MVPCAGLDSWGMDLDLLTRARLSTMMFLEFFVWGAWFVTLGTYLATDLQASGSQISLAFLTQSLGAILAPFIVGLIADRFFAAQRILGVLHVVSAVMLFLAGRQEEFGPFFVLALLAMVSFMPTLALANSISFRRLASPEKQFPSIRVFGTIGWIIAGLLIGWLGWEAGGALANTFVMAAIGSALLGIYAFTLPHTPPQPAQGRATVRDVLGLDALALLRSRSFLVFFLSSILICIPLAFYYNFTNLYLNEIGVRSAAAVQSLGQVSEALFLLIMPLMLKKLGIKWTLLIGSLISGPIVDAFLAADGTHAWRAIWLIPAALAVGVALFFATLFREKEGTGPTVSPAGPAGSSPT
ncbi:MFS transporter [Brachybacterium rhamnosum]|uniref:MFS transporter n=1 Tax=Brachybacterium rhamnosum TaxID=173361 RepID=A0ABW4PUM6_9MICO